jgi:hypothetical protein
MRETCRDSNMVYVPNETRANRFGLTSFWSNACTMMTTDDLLSAQHLNCSKGRAIEAASRGGRVRAQVMWYLGWTNWHWGRFPPSTLVSRANFHSTKCSTLLHHPGLVQQANMWPTYHVDSVSPHHHEIIKKKKVRTVLWVASRRCAGGPTEPNSGTVGEL